jgi:hypothetical protein
MNKEQTNERNGSNAKKDTNVETEPLAGIEKLAVLILELSQKILGKLESVEDSVEILAREKARELNPED